MIAGEVVGLATNEYPTTPEKVAAVGRIALAAAGVAAEAAACPPLRPRTVAGPRPGYVPKGPNGEPLDVPNTPHGEPMPDSTPHPHPRIGLTEGRNGPYIRTREFGANGVPVKEVHWTDHGRPNVPGHTDPHVHDFSPNPTGGTMSRGDPRPPRPGEF